MRRGHIAATSIGGMDEAPLDNPVWSALDSGHARFGRGTRRVRRYPADVAPFLGVAGDQGLHGPELEALVPAGDTVYLLGVLPELLPGWSTKAYPELAQMICTAPLPVPDGPEIRELGEEDREEVLALTALVYPHYFRPRTMELGRYLGIRIGGRLAAIAGERMAPGPFQEISAVCTHPDFLGRGHARRLMARLGNDVLARGGVPFLHVSHENIRAKSLYLRMGYRVRRDIPFWSLRRI